MKAKYFGYNIIKTYPLRKLQLFKSNRRIAVFFHKGTKCRYCGIIGTEIGIGVDKVGGVHVDIYTDDGVPLTVDHIVPISKGGKWDMDNLQPLCTICNTKKGCKVEG